MAEPKLPNILEQIHKLPFDEEKSEQLFNAFYSDDPRASFEAISGVPLSVKQKLFEIRGKAEQGQPYSLEDIYISVKPSKKGAGLAEEEKPKEEWVGPKEAIREREFKATTAIPVVGKSPEVSPTPFAKKKEVEVDFFGRPVQPKTSKAALAPKLVKLEKSKPGAAKEAPEEEAPAPATAPPPVVAEPKTAEPPAPLLSREEMESRYANYIKEQAEKAEKALKEKQPKGKVDKGKDSTAKKYQDIQIQAEEIAAPPSPVIVLNPYKPGTPEYEAERKRSAQTPVEVVQGPAKSFSQGLGQAIEYSVEQVPKTAKALSKAAAASEPGGKEYVTKKELLESGKTMREPLARPELLVPGGDGREDLTREFVRGGLEAVGGLTAPETIAVVAGTKGLGTAAGLATGITRSALKAATSALSAYFTGQAGVSAYDKGKEAVELYEKGDYEAAARALGVASIDALFALMGAAHSGKKAKESFKEGYARGQRRRANVETGFEDKFQKAVGEDFEPVPGQPGMLRLKKKPTAPAAGELPAAGEPKPATAKERSIIEYYKEDPTGVYGKLVNDIGKKTAEIAQASRHKTPNKNKIKKLGKELDVLNKQKALIDRLRQGEEVEQPAAPPPVVTTEPAQPPLAISAEPPPVVEEAPVVEPPPVVEPAPPAAEPVKAAVEPTVKPTVAETFSTPGGAKITDITQTSPEGFTPGIDYIPETDFIFDVEGIGKFTVIPSAEKPGSFAIWPEGDVAPAAVVEGANAKEAFTSFIDKPAPEVKVEAPVTPTGTTEAPPAPGVTAPTAKPPVEEPKPTGLPDWAREAIDRNFAQAQRMGIVDRIAELSAEGLTARQVYERLPELEVKTSNNPEKDTIAVQDAVTIVRSVRGKLGIPSMDDRTAFNAWRESYLAKKKPPVEEPKAATEPPPPVVAAAPPMPAPAPAQPPAPPVEPKPEGKKSPPPDRRSMIQRGMHDPVTVFFKDSRDKSLFDAESKLSGALRGRKEYSSDVIKNLENYGNYFSEKLGIQPQETRSLIARYRQMVIDRAKAMPKAEPDVLEVPSFIEFAKAEIEAAKAKETPAPVPPEPSETPAAPKPPAEPPKAATEPPQEYIPGTDGEVYVWMDYIGSDGKLSRKPTLLGQVKKSEVANLLQRKGRKLPQNMRIYLTGKVLPGSVIAKPDKNTPYRDINKSYIEDIMRADYRDEGEPGYKERLASEIQKLQSLFDVPATVPAEKPKKSTGKKTKKGEAPVSEPPAPSPAQPQPPVELTPKPPVTPSEPGGGPVAVKEKAPRQVEPSEKEIQQEEKALEFYSLDELPKKTAKMSSYFGDATSNKTRTVTVYNGEAWHTDGHALVKGEHPGYWKEGTINNQPSLSLKGIVPDEYTKTEPVQPIAYKHWLKEEGGARKRKIQDEAIIMSDGGSISGEYYRYVKNKVNPDEWRVFDKNKYVAYKDGKPVAVVMGLRGVTYNKESVSMSLRERKNVRQKEIWEMSTSELLKRQKANNSNPDYREALAKNDTHDKIVAEAVLSGKPVPEYVVEGMGTGFRWVSDTIVDKLYPQGLKEAPGEYDAYGKFEEKVKPIVLDYLERVREGENPGDIYEFVKRKLEPGPNPPGFTPAPPELPKPKDKPAAEAKKPSAKVSEEIKAEDIEEVSVSGEGEIEFAYKGKRYQASPIFDGKGYRFYDMESGKNIGEFKKSSYLEDPKEALAEILNADRELKELSGDTETPDAKPEKTEITPTETPKIQTKYIEPKTPQYREDNNLVALKLRSDRKPVIWVNDKSQLDMIVALQMNGVHGLSPNSMGMNFDKASNVYSLIDAVLAKPVGMFKGTKKQRDLLVAVRDAMQEARAFSALNGKDGGFFLINVDSPNRQIRILPSAYEAVKGLVKGKSEKHTGTVSDLIRTFRHEGVHSELATIIRDIPSEESKKIMNDPSVKKIASALFKKGGYDPNNPYIVINEFVAHFLSGDKEFFKASELTIEELADTYSLVRPYILAIDKDAASRAERFKKPGLKVSESDPAKLSGTSEQTVSPNLNEITGVMFSTQPPPGRSVKPKTNVQSSNLIEEVVKTTEEQQNLLDKVIESTYGKYSPKQQSLLEKIVEQQLSVPKERGELEMSTRIPLSKKAKEDVAKDVLVIGLNSIAENPKMLNTVIEKMTVARDKEGKKIYHGLSGLNLAEGDPIKSAKQIMDRMVDNLLWLHDKMPQEQRDRAKLWYDGANKLINKWSKEYSADPQAVAGVIAVLSPQKDWYQNAEMARKILEAYKKRSSLKWNPKMDEFLFSKDALVENGEAEGLNDEGASIEDIIAKEERIKKSSSNFYKAAQKIKGKDFNELTSTYEKAVWLRAHDEVTSDRSFRILLPEGQFGDIAVIESGKNKGQRMKMAWQSYAAIEKAIDIMENDSYENISDKLGTKHKVRNFYNNMLFPNSKNGHVTIDTHAVAAALLQPLSSSNVEVNDNFGGISSASTGSQGTYGLIAEAYRKAAAKRGLLAREMQSITWEAVRGLFEAKFKQQDSNKKAINDIWNKLEESKKSDINKIREEILKAAGGMRKPSWVGQGLRTSPPPKKK